MDNLSNEEIIELKKVIENKWKSIRQQEIIDAVEEDRKEK